MPKSAYEIALVLLLVAAGAFLLFSSSGEGKAGLPARVVYAVLRPAQEAAFGGAAYVSGIWRGYVALVDVRKENLELKAEVRRLKQENNDLAAKKMEHARLTQLLGLRARGEYLSVAARVIGEDALGWSKILFLNRGTDDGVAPGMPVTVPEGLVGRVTGAAGGVSRVTLITDPQASVDCRIQGTRVRGLLSGLSAHECVLRYIDKDVKVEPGASVVTSGLVGQWPPNIPVGKTASVGPAPQGLFQEAVVTPAADLDDVEEALIVLGGPRGFDIRPGFEDAQ
jgi:rod shape-determining protein MreC